jgi:CheY-like chemotaxis protein
MITPPERQYILYIEDDTEDVELLNYILDKTGFSIELLQMRNGADALDFLESAKLSNRLPELILLDINLPKLDGKETFVCLKSDKRLARIPVAVLSTSNYDGDMSYFKKYQVPYILKPGNIASFGEDIAGLLKTLLVL